MEPQNEQNLNNNLPSVQKARDAETKEKDQETKKDDKIGSLQQKIRSNKIIFYGLPLVVIAYGVAVLTFLVVPAVEKYFQVNSDSEVLDQNIANMKSSSSNLQDAVANIETYDTYDTELSTFIPTEARIGQLIDLLQNQANDFGLERAEFTTPDPNAPTDRSSIDNLAQLDDDNKALFQSVNAGEIEFTPRTLSEGTKARLLEIDMTVKGNRDSLLSFLESLGGIKPLVNLVYIDYQEIPDQSGNPVAAASLRFESYSLKLTPTKTIAPRKFTINDISLTTAMSVETFNVSAEIQRTLDQAGQQENTGG
jgi:cell division protein FtsL